MLCTGRDTCLFVNGAVAHTGRHSLVKGISNSFFMGRPYCTSPARRHAPTLPLRSITQRLEDDIIAGTTEGGRRASETNKRKYGDSYYARIGALGGKVPTDKPKGFAALSPEKHLAVSSKGGSVSKRYRKVVV